MNDLLAFCGSAIASMALLTTTQAQAPTLVADINVTASGYDSNVDGGYAGPTTPVSFARVGGYWYFTARSLATGNELWRTDGTASGTSLVKDIHPGPGSSNPTGLTVIGGTHLMFAADDGVRGEELWVSDGTTVGTQLLLDIRPGSPESLPRSFHELGALVCFTAFEDSVGRELWVTDMTPSGTHRLGDLNPGSPGSDPTGFIDAPGGMALLFACTDGIGTELWSTDGTLAGTGLLADINPGATGSDPVGFTRMGGRVYFAATSGTDRELWSTDGTGPGTSLVANLNPAHSSSPVLDDAVVWNGELYFSADDGSSGREVFKTDGVNISLVWDVAPGSQGSLPSGFCVHNGDLYFIAFDSSVGTELRRVSVGGAQATISDINPFGSSFGSVAKLLSQNGLLFFGALTALSGFELCVSDGTQAGTGLLADMEPGAGSSLPGWFTPVSPTQVMFAATTGTNGRELWVTDGTAAGTHLLVEIDATVVTASSSPTDILSCNGRDLVFAASTPATGKELFAWSPVNGLTLLRDIRPGGSGSEPSRGTYGWLNGADVIVFAADDRGLVPTLWKTDGTPAGTVPIPGSPDDPRGFIYYAGRIFFSASVSGTGTELWATDGTAAGTALVADINPGAIASLPGNFCLHRGLLYFSALVGTGGGSVGFGEELWVTDGTTAGTHMVADIRPGPVGSGPRALTSFRDVLLFTADDGAAGRELWKTDGTAAGTARVYDFAPGSESGAPFFMLDLNGQLWLSANGGPTVGIELWSSDLTAAGTVLHDLNPGPGSSEPRLEAVADGHLYFVANDGTTGREPWVTDGTPVGTHLLADLNPGSGSSNATNFVAVGPDCYFNANSGPATGAELWFADATAATTSMIAEIRPGPDGSNPQYLALASGGLFFAAQDPVVGTELFELSLPGAYATAIGHSGDGSRFSCTAPVLGQVWTWNWHDVPTNGFSARVLGVPLDHGSGALMHPSSSAWVDLLASPYVLEFSVLPDGNGSVFVPNDPAFVGIRLNFQSFSIPASILPLGSSNAMSVVFGA